MSRNSLSGVFDICDYSCKLCVFHFWSGEDHLIQDLYRENLHNVFERWLDNILFFCLVTSCHLAGLYILARWFVGTWKWLPATHRCKVVLPYIVVSSYWSEYSIAERSVCLKVKNLIFSNGVLFFF